MVDPNMVYELHKTRENDLFAKARESSLLEAAKNARPHKAVGASWTRLGTRFPARILDLLVFLGL